ncbi:MAG TPA: hypothetical protein VIN34_01035 [Candidatus Limnocylindria bacterium]
MIVLRPLLLAVVLAIAGLGAGPAAPAAAACASSVGPGIPPPASASSGIDGFHAAWWGQSGYMRLCPGERSTAVVAYRNSGSNGWVADRMGEAAYLGTWGPEPGQDRPSPLGGDGTNGGPATGWPRYDRIAVQPAAYVGPDQVAWFSFTVQAPTQPGVYRLHLRPLVEGAAWMEDVGVFWQIVVLGADGSLPAGAVLPPAPARWPRTLQLGLADAPGGAGGLRAAAPFGFRYQYLAGGANTGQGWATWNPDGGFVSSYVRESRDAGITPFFSYYQLLGSAPGGALSEPLGNYTNLATAATMRAVYDDLTLFFSKAGAFPDTTVVLQVEPDLWGYIQQRWGDDAGAAPIVVGSSGNADVAGLPDSARGFAQAVLRLRDRYAPNVLVSYHLSVWGTNHDLLLEKPDLATADLLARSSAAFYRSLQAPFDLATAEFSDRDADFYRIVRGEPGHWWDGAAHDRNLAFLSRFVTEARVRVVEWQIPLGNTVMRAQDNTWGHYQDNLVQTVLADPALRDRYVKAGVIAFLFGGGADGTTCACDARGDGVTDPAAIAGNTRAALSADDDGGYFKEQAARYYAAGAVTLP